MAVAFDNVTTDTGTSASSTSFSHTTSGEQRLLLVWISNYPSENQSGPAPTAVTYGGVSMTAEGNVTDGFPNDESHLYLYSLVNPASGPNTVSVTWSASVTEFQVVAISFTGVDQADATGLFQSNQGSSTTPSVNVSSEAGDMVADCAIVFDRTFTVGSGQTERFNLNGTNQDSAGSTEPGAATVTMSWTLSSSQNWGIGAINIRAADVQNIQVDKGNLTLDEQNVPIFVVSSATEGQLSLAGQDITFIATEEDTIVVESADLVLAGQEITLAASMDTLGIDRAILSLIPRPINLKTLVPLTLPRGTFDSNNKTL
jgi:hypothetical protein